MAFRWTHCNATVLNNTELTDAVASKVQSVAAPSDKEIANQVGSADATASKVQSDASPFGTDLAGNQCTSLHFDPATIPSTDDGVLLCSARYTDNAFIDALLILDFLT